MWRLATAGGDKLVRVSWRGCGLVWFEGEGGSRASRRGWGELV